MKGIREKLETVWVMEIGWQYSDQTPGVVRSLRAMAAADVDELVADLEETKDDRVAAAWLAWYPQYVAQMCGRVLPELREKWPTREARHARKTKVQLTKRWQNDAAKLVNWLGGQWHDRSEARSALGLRKRRFGRLVAALVQIGAVRARKNQLLAVATSAWAREKILPLSPQL